MNTKNKNKSNSAFARLGDITRPSLSINKQIISATNAPQLGELFDNSFNANVGILSKNQKELDRLTHIAEQLLHIIPREKMTFVNIVLVDNEMDLKNEVFAGPDQIKPAMTDDQRAQLQKSALLFLQHVLLNSCIKYASIVNKNWNKDELVNEIEKMKELVARTKYGDEVESKPSTKPLAKPLLFTKKKGIDTEHEKIGNLKHPKDEIGEKDDKFKLLFTAPRAREDSLPSDLVKAALDGSKKSYSFLDLLAADGYETKDLETFEEQVILKLDRLKEHILHQFNTVFNELNEVRKRLRIFAEHNSLKKYDRKSIMRQK